MEKFVVSASPHLRDETTTQTLMKRVCFACIPAVLASVLIFGIRSLILICVSVAAAVAFEALWNLLRKQEQTVGDLSAVVTGILLAFNVPADLPVWMLVIGDFIAIIVVKQLFGGIGYNFANPAIVARIVLSLSFTGQMTPKPFSAAEIDALASATPLAAASQLEETPYVTLLLGTHGGVLGETCAIALLLGGIYLIVTKTISAAIPVSMLLGTAGMCVLCGHGDQILLQLLSGGLLLGAFYMATDYVTSPYTFWGRVVYGLGAAVLTCVIRFYAPMAEGMSYAILLMNIVTPYINRGIRQRPLGVGLLRKKRGDRKE